MKFSYVICSIRKETSTNNIGVALNVSHKWQLLGIIQFELKIVKLWSILQKGTFRSVFPSMRVWMTLLVLQIARRSWKDSFFVLFSSTSYLPNVLQVIGVHTKFIMICGRRGGVVCMYVHTHRHTYIKLETVISKQEPLLILKQLV